MSQDNTPSETASNRADSQSTAASRLPKQAMLIVVLLSLFAVEPAAAQTNAVCSADNLPSMIEGFFQLTTALGIVGLAVVWQADSLIEMFTITPDQKKGLKRHKRSAMKSTVVLVALGPLYTVAGSMMGLPLAQCVDLAPW
ncbi:hypothetical protein [Halobellus clavatus]|uniref:Uncharacterized protein n=1 Tax=Halobellus clavatus TaxID=660517 RepID=A0A1H3JWW4_9EURY|nr:hypothetical protein [Halobellus clavatus]SDY44432.1 hypothetical protein SAMN04487946_1167 [Halobellus clavatus]